MYILQTACTMSHVNSVKCPASRYLSPCCSVVRVSERCAAGHRFDCSRDFLFCSVFEILNGRHLTKLSRISA